MAYVNPEPLPPKKPRRLLGFRRSAILEIGLYLGAAIFLDTLFFDGHRFHDVRPHPFWPIVLLVSAQYGTIEGLLAAAAATIAVTAGHLPEQSFTQDLYDYLFSIAREPILWFAAAVVFGELRGRHIRTIDTLQTDLDVSRRRGGELAEAYKRMSTLKDGLETRAAGQLRTAVTMYQAARQMERLNPDEVLSGVKDVVRVSMNPQQFSLFLLTDNRLRVILDEGWPQDASYAREFGPESPLFAEVIGRRQLLCIANPDHESVLGSEGMLAAPLVCPETGSISGMLKVEKMGFLDLHASSLQTFRVLSEWIATAHANAIKFERARSQSFRNDETQLLSYSFLGRQIDFLSDLGRRLGFDVSMLVLRLENADALSPEDQKLVPVAINETVQTCLRRTDMAFDYERAGSQFSVLLPNTPLVNARIVADKMTGKFADVLGLKSNAIRVSVETIAVYEHKFDRKPGTLWLPRDTADRNRLGSTEVLEWQRAFLSGLSRRVGFHMTEVLLAVDRRRVTPELIAAASDALGQAINEIIPDQADAYDFDPRFSGFTILMPGVQVRDAELYGELILGRLEDLIRERTGSTVPGLSIQVLETSGLEPDMSHA